MRVSIITVCLNSEKTIEQTIQSVIGQKYEDLEYIIVDGKSSDNTMKIVEKYRDNISVVISEPDEGLYYAMNKGIKVATGDVIGIINSDDWYEEGAFEKIETVFRNTQADVVYGQMNLIKGNDVCGVKVPRDIELLRIGMDIGHPTVFVKSDIYMKYGVFDTQYKICADRELLLRYYVQGVKFQYVESVLANFRTSGLSSRMTMENVIDGYNVSMKYLNCVSGEKREYYKKKIVDSYIEYSFLYKIDEETHRLIELLKSKYDLKDDISLVIWGAGIWGMKACCALKSQGVKIDFIVDNNQKMWNKNVDGIMVLEPERLKEYKGIVLIMVRDYSKEIAQQINEMNNTLVKAVRWEELIEDLGIPKMLTKICLNSLEENEEICK